MKKLAAALLALVFTGCGGGGGGHVVPLAEGAVGGPMPPVVAALGDSITAGLIPIGGSPSGPGAGYNANAALAYPARVGSAIGASTVTNLGIPGATNATILGEVPSIPANATLIIVNAGTNDIWPSTGTLGFAVTETLAQAEAGFDAIIAAIRVHNPAARIVVLDLRDYARTLPNPTGIEYFIDNYDPHVLATPNVTAIELANRPGADDLSNFPDSIHPSPAGVLWIADAITSAL